MSYQVLARKWRPRNFQQIVGQTHVVRALTNALDAGRLHHAFLFSGTRGVGKTTIARILAKCLNCEKGVSSEPCGECSACTEIDEGRYMDLIEVDAASRSKVEETRELMDNVQFAPARGRYKVYLIDEVHMFSEKSFNALLKTLEEPPPHVKFLFATTDPQKLPVTVLSRCLQFNLKRLPADEIATYLTSILADEQVEAEAAGLRLIAAAADGSMRDALSLLDQAVSYGGGKLVDTDVRAMLGTLDVSYVYALLEALLAGDGPALMEGIENMASEVTDYAEALAELVSELQRIAVAQVVPDAAVVDDTNAEARKALAEKLNPEDVQLYYQMGIMSGRDLALAPDPRSGFEMALLRMLAFRPAAAVTSGTPGTGAARGTAPRTGTQQVPATGAAQAPSAATAKASAPQGQRPRVADAQAPRQTPAAATAKASAPQGQRPRVADAQAPRQTPAAATAKASAPQDQRPRAADAQAPRQTPAAATAKASAPQDQRPRAADAQPPRQPPEAPPERESAPVSQEERAVRAQAPADGVSRTIKADEWAADIDAMGLVGLTRELAFNCLVVESSEQSIKLRLDPGHEQLTAAKIKQKLGHALERYCGRALRVEIEITAPNGETPALAQQREAELRRQAAVQAIENDSDVKAICDTFGAQVDTQRVRPVD